jgi:hypothetical protein
MQKIKYLIRFPSGGFEIRFWTVEEKEKQLNSLPAGSVIMDLGPII